MAQKKYWLLKSEPSVFSIEDLEAAPQQKTLWEGVRNYQARNFMRDEMAVGDEAFFYHSNAKTTGIAGIVKVVKKAYPDPSQFNPKSEYFDAAASPENPRWFCVDVGFVKKFSSVITLEELKKLTGLKKMILMQRGRLSVQPVKATEWDLILDYRKKQ